MASVQAAAERYASLDAASAVTQRVLGSAPGIDGAAQRVLRAGVEVRSGGTLAVTGHWAPALVTTPSSDAVAGVRVGETALTLRAADALTVRGSLGSGFAGSSGDLRGWTPGSDLGGAIRAVAGADLGAAQVSAVLSPASGSAPSLTVGVANATTPTLVRSTTGRVELHAAGHIVLANKLAAVYTTGAEPVAALPGAPVIDDFQLLQDLMPATNAAGHLSPFLRGGGAVQLKAGGRISAPAAEEGEAYLATAWWWRGAQADAGLGPAAALWWSRPDLFKSGVASFGGGNVSVQAGGSIQQLNVAAASSGWMATAESQAAGGNAGTGVLPGGTVSVRSGGDLVGGSLLAGGSSLSVRSGGRIGGDTSATGNAALAPELVYQGTAVELSATGDIVLSRLRSAGYTAPAIDNRSGVIALEGLDSSASLRITSRAGSVTSQNLGQIISPQEVSASGWAALGSTLPTVTRIAAPQGSVTLGGSTVQATAGEGVLQLLAADRLTVGGLGVLAGGVTPPLRSQSDAEGVLARWALDAWSIAGTRGRQLDATSRDTVTLVAERGDLTLGGALQSARPVLLSAGRDIVLQGAASVVVQHQTERSDGALPQPVSELTLLRAGRDITAVRASSGADGITVAGPGDLLLVAGRDIDLGASAGVQAVGNQRNSTLLPEGGAHLTLAAGIRLDGSDVAAAVAGGWALTGTQGLVDRPAQLAQWLSSGSTATAEQETAFNAQTAERQLAAAQALLGADYDAALARTLRAMLALGMQPAKAREAVQAQSAALLADAATSADVQRILAAPLAERAALAAATLADTARGLRIAEPALAVWLRAVLAQSLDAGNAQATLAAFSASGSDLQRRAVGGLLAEAFAARPAAERLAYTRQQLALAGTRQAQGTAQATDRQLLADAQALVAYLARAGAGTVAPADAAAVFATLPLQRQLPWLARRLRTELAAAGEAAGAVVQAGGSGEAFDAAYALGHLAVAALFPQASRGGGDAADAGDIRTPTSQIRTAQAADILLLAPTGGINAGELLGSSRKRASELGIVTVAGGDIFAAVRDHIEVNQSRVFTLARGDILLWAADGNLDAGRGAKTVVGAPAPVLRLDANGNLVVDTTGSFSGSGIATLDAGSSVRLLAPRGEVNAGEAGISAAGGLSIVAPVLKGADNIAAAGPSSVPSAPVAAAAPSLSGLAAPTAAAAAASSGSGQDDDERKKRRRRNVFLDFLGFGSGD